MIFFETIFKSLYDLKWRFQWNLIYSILEAAPNKAAAVRPPTTHYENYQN